MKIYRGQSLSHFGGIPKMPINDQSIRISGLVHFVECLADLSGSRSEAFELAARFVEDGVSAFSGAGDETIEFLKRRARHLGLIDGNDMPDAAVTADLMRVAEVVREVPQEGSRTTYPRLVFTVPENARSLVAPSQRLSYLVEDLIRMSVSTLTIGGPFWNEEGMAQLTSVLKPAIENRGVECTFYIHAWESKSDREQIIQMISAIAPERRMQIWWYHGPRNSLLHAKFVIADSSKGILSTANLTSLGLDHHVEVGIPLTESQCKDLESFLDGLVTLGLLAKVEQLKRESR